MIIFKEVPKKIVLSLFLLSISLILILYFDTKTYQKLPEIEILESGVFEIKDLDVSHSILHSVKDGENISVIFENYKIPLNTAYKIFRADEKNLLSKVRPRDMITFDFDNKKLNSISIARNNMNLLNIILDEKVNITKLEEKIDLITSYRSGVINSSFYEDAKNSGIPDSVIMDFAFIFGWDIDFVFDVRPGDSFSLIYEHKYIKGQEIDNGDIIFAEFVNNNKKYYALRFYNHHDKKEYFDENGNNMQKAFLRTPLEFAYISSHFNPNRMHPVLHKIKAHNGVDYAAKRGTPVRSTGEGQILFMGRKNGCGNEIVIKHTLDYSTRYCHLDRFANYMRKGKKIEQGQIIGYVGSTGLATGPHLHYEFKIGNKNIDPVKMKLPSAEGVFEDNKAKFNTMMIVNKDKLNELNKKFIN